MSRCRVFIYSTLILLSLSGSSSGYELLEPGVRANSLGGAFVGISDDWSAIYWNPAGLFQLLDRELAIEGEYLSLDIRDGNSIVNDGTGVFGYRKANGAAKFSEESISQSHYLPSIGFVLPVKGLALGFGIYPRLSDHLDWKDDDAQDLKAELSRRIEIYSGGLSFSAHIAPVVYAGAGLNLLHGEYELSADKAYTGGSYTYKYHLDESRGTGLEVILGVLYQPQQLLSVGVVYRSGGVISLHGDAEASCTPYPDEESDYTRRIHLPPSYGIGIAIRHLSKTTIGIDWSRVGWDSWREDYVFEDGDNLLIDPAEDTRNPGWSGADRWRLGLEIKPTPRWEIRLGGSYNQSPLPDSGIDLANGMVEVDRLGLSGGVGYKVGNWEFSLGCLLSNAQDEIDGVEYQRDLSRGLISIKAHFF